MVVLSDNFQMSGFIFIYFYVSPHRILMADKIWNLNISIMSLKAEYRNAW